MSRKSIIALSLAALLVVAALAVGLFARSSMQAAPAVNEPAIVVPDMAQSVGPVAARSVFVSEAELQWNIEEAADHHWDARAQELLRILNKRHEHRCCGLSR